MHVCTVNTSRCACAATSASHINFDMIIQRRFDLVFVERITLLHTLQAQQHTDTHAQHNRDGEDDDADDSDDTCMCACIYAIVTHFLFKDLHRRLDFYNLVHQGLLRI